MHAWLLALYRCGALFLAATVLVSCDTPRQQALKELTQFGIEASGRSLVQALLDQDTKRAALLLEAGTHTELRDSRGRTPLGIAVENRDLSAVCMLLNARANVNATLDKHSSILGIAAESGDDVMIDILLVSGAQPDGLMPDGEKILPWAIRHGRLHLVQTMMKSGADPHLKDRHGNPLLHVAMKAGRRDLMDSLLKLGADPGATNTAGETTIHLALQQGWIDVISKLVAAGADPNAHGPDGHTLLEQAIATGNPARVALILSIGADPNHRPHLDQSPTPLQQVFERQSATLFEVFLNHGARPTPDGWNSWLWRAFHKRDHEKARLLLSHGARPSNCLPQRTTLLEAAVLAGDADFVKLLLDYGCPTGRALYLASARGDAEMLSVLLACGTPPCGTRFPTRDTALAAAIRGRHDRAASWLIQYGADTTLSLPEGQSAFHLAIATGCPHTVQQLLSSGANPNAPFVLPVSPTYLAQVRPGIMRWILKVDRNATPLMLAADSGSIQTARHLLDAGANIQAHTRVADFWPMDFAAHRSDVRMMRLLLGQDPYREERVIEIFLSEQRARVNDATGNEIFTTPVSTGRRGFATPTGEFIITNKHRDWTSTLYHASMPYFLRLSCGDFGLHQGNVPGYPASHGCIRVPAGKAAKLFFMTQTGDRVRIFP